MCAFMGDIGFHFSWVDTDRWDCCVIQQCASEETSTPSSRVLGHFIFPPLMRVHVYSSFSSFLPTLNIVAFHFLLFL